MKRFLLLSNRVATGCIASLLIILSVLVFTGCSDKDNPLDSYPRTVDIEYRITCTAGNVTNANSGSYTNETGGDSGLSNYALPFSKTIRRSVDFGDIITLGAWHNNSAVGAFSLKLDILVNGSVKKSQTFSDPSAINAAISYSFD